MSLPLLLLVMALATYRLTRLAVADTFPPVLWLRDRLAGGWRPLTGSEQRALVVLPADKALDLRRGLSVDDEGENRYVYRWRLVPEWIAELLSCPWCASGWVALGVTGGVWAVDGMPVPPLVWLAVWAGGALLAAQEWA